jgi:putative DNA primase/helicase
MSANPTPEELAFQTAMRAVIVAQQTHGSNSPEFAAAKLDVDAARTAWESTRPPAPVAPPPVVEKAKPAAPAALAPDPRIPVVMPSDTLETARKFLKTQYTVGNHPTVVWWRDEFYRFTATGAWDSIQLTAVHNQIWHYLERERSAGLSPTDKHTNEVLKGLKGLTLLPETVDAPCWHQTRTPLTNSVILCRNGILFPSLIGTEHAMQAHTPGLFALAALPVDYNPDAIEPMQWLKFLNALWANDPASIDTLQELFGLLLTDDMSFEKIFLLVGPTRSGKGTILKIIKALLGADTVAAPTLNSLGGEFGMQPLIGKLAALIGDARSGKGEKQIIGTERLLTVSGGDPVDVNRKNRSFWSGRLAVRFVLASNVVPGFADAAGVIAARFVVLRLTESFLGHEDAYLFGRLCTELPGILNWALVGRDRLYNRGRFEQPESATDDINQIRNLASPVSAFLHDWCSLSSDATVGKDDHFRAWREYCNEVNDRYPGTLESFSRDMYAAAPSVRSIRPREGGKIGPRVFAGIALKPRTPHVSPAITVAPTLIRGPCSHGWADYAIAPCPICCALGVIHADPPSDPR